MGIVAKNIVIGKKEPENTRPQKIQTLDEIKFNIKEQEFREKREQKQRLGVADIPTKPKKRDIINKRKQESQFLSVMKNKE